MDGRIDFIMFNQEGTMDILSLLGYYPEHVYT